MAVTGAMVVQALKTDHRVKGPRDPQLTLLQPYVMALPDILADMLDKQVDLSTLFEAKMRFTRHCRDNGFIDNAARMLAFGLVGDEYTDLVTEQTAKLTEQFEQMLHTDLDNTQ